MKIKVGDMVHIPSGAYIFQYQTRRSVHRPMPKKLERLHTPCSLLVVGENRETYEILKDGVSWYVHKTDAHKLK